MENYDIKLHVQGLSQFVDDINLPDDSLFAYVYTAPSSHGKITKLDLLKAKSMKDVIAVYTYEDIPGKNQIGHIIADEPLLAETTFEYTGQPIAFVVAKSKKAAQLAVKQIEMEYEPLEAVYDPIEAYQKGSIIGAERVFSCGNIDKSWSKCDYIFSNTVRSGSQEHLYLETQSAIAMPTESGRIKIISSTQSPSSVQKTAADVLGVSLNQIETEVIRLGGGFGGKEDQANAWAAMAAIAAKKLNKCVKIVLPRKQDIEITGKRHPYSAKFRIGMNEDLKIICYEVTFYQNAGAFADLSPAILERTLFHSTNSYNIPHVRAKAVSCKTNLPPYTAFRGFGAPQAMFIMESAIYEIASELLISAADIQKKNIIRKGDTFPYGMQIQTDNAKLCFDKTKEIFEIDKKQKAVEKFNKTNKFKKQGLAIMPVCFGVSFTNTILNQASALVHIYNDGSLSISTGAVEMGQGVNEKIRKTAAKIFSIDEKRIRIETTNTSRIANISPTAASTGADLNGNATKIACEEILNRLKQIIPKFLGTNPNDKYEIINETVYYNSQKTDLKWDELILKTYRERVSLSNLAYYATPGIYFDKTKEKGNPFLYHVTGSAIIQVTIDCIKGIPEIDSVDIIHDIGKSIAPQIDLGQIEGGLLQGLGWMTMEEIQYSAQGKLMTNTLSTYKVPDIFSIPKQMQVRFLENSDEQFGLLGSKAIGEPPFMYGIGVYFALMNAIKSFNDNIKVKYSAPLTNEKILMMLYRGV